MAPCKGHRFRGMGLLYEAGKKGRMRKKTWVGFGRGVLFYPGDHPSAQDRHKGASGQALGVRPVHGAEVRTSETQQVGELTLLGVILSL